VNVVSGLSGDYLGLFRDRLLDFLLPHDAMLEPSAVISCEKPHNQHQVIKIIEILAGMPGCTGRTKYKTLFKML